jgi:hypothetical protein
MHSDANTDCTTPRNDEHEETEQRQQPLLEDKDWELALMPYQDNPSAALDMAFNLAKLRMNLDSQPIKPRKSIEALDLALEMLFSYTAFREVSFNLFRKLTDRQLELHEEQLLTALGIEF